ncbi:hypothetical protein LRP30_13700 [Bradyrhizobium sp. C-145]|uniref:hypothetical protein n=1 Tax=Bradyrhizobium sp. C-145 TaxID=574727 RepID=UPI00201B69D7|nr:hypothetical protein [Bradyrhizobium sp. C-145]UQR66237.1 hypothetical protein LRP30_13700 [Bradyrhizobium sp. C-145]
MPDDRHVYRPTNLNEENKTRREQIRQLTERARKVLDQPMPDTFLGRKTHEPFPEEPNE